MGVITAVKAVIAFTLLYMIAIFWTIVRIFPLFCVSFIRNPTRFFQRKKRENRPTCLSDPSLGSHSFVRLKDIRMHYVMNGKEDKPLMLFMHGFPEGWYSWRHQLKEFSKDYKCVAIDMRGYGETDKPTNVYDYTMEKLLGDVKEFITAIGHQSCVLVSHDWGGIIAYTFAEKHPDMVDKLIVLNAPHRLAFAEMFNQNKKQLIMSWYIFAFQLPWLPEFMLSHSDFAVLRNIFKGKDGADIGAMTKEDIEAYVYYFSQPNALTSAINYYRASMRERVWRTAQGKKLSPRKEHSQSGRIIMPALAIWGDADTALHKDLPELARKHVDDYTLKYIHGCSHWTQQERPDAVNEIMKEFLKGKKLE